jgi:hypothetical protein
LEVILKKWFFVATCCAIFAPISALATVYDCKFKVPNGSWTPPQVIMAYDADTGEALAFDALVKEFVGKPVPAKISSQTNAKIAFSWSVKAHDGAGHTSNLVMRLAYFKATKEAQMTTVIPGYANNDTVFGSCKLQ